VQDSGSTRFKKKLRALRKARGWTQEAAAEKCGVGYKLFQLYELGVKRNPGLLTLEKIARGFGLDISELLDPNFPKKKIPSRKARNGGTKRKAAS
jgi:transcriptional regulator with XRE-family HTH domain